jgi:hypothetical protein
MNKNKKKRVGFYFFLKIKKKYVYFFLNVFNSLALF